MKTLQSRQFELGYRPDIEGLRAVAILLVVAAHAKIHWLAGGFVGVDVFFVLSGYLITGLLLREAHHRGSIRFRLFYARRLRRLLPALLLMLGITGWLGSLLIVPGGLLHQYQAAAAASLWISNFYFTFSNLGYFSPGANTNLYLHTWSLGVEEQFYLIWPLLLVLALGLWEGNRRAPSPQRLRVVMLAVFCASFVASALWTGNDPHFAFYMMPARAWQFALGALVFLGFGSPSTDQMGAPASCDSVSKNPSMLRRGAGWAGLGLIILSALMIDSSVPYPGFWALLPSVGTAVVLAAGAAAPRSGAGRILSLRPMQGLGRVSYGWYLWHWPVLLLGATLVVHESGAYRLGLVPLSLILAILSYWLVEMPIRRARIAISRPAMAIFCGLALMVLGNVLAIRGYNHARARMQTPEQLRYERARFDAPIIYGMGCDDWYHSAKVQICEFGPENAPHTAVAFGDSVALQWFPAYAKVFDHTGWRLLVITKSSCPLVDEPIFYQRIGRVYTECSQWRNRALQKIAAIQPDIVIMGSTFSYAFDRQQWIRGTERILRPLSKAAGHVYIMRSTPILPFDGPSCLAPRSKLYMGMSERSDCSAPDHGHRSNNVFKWLSMAAERFGNVSLVDMTQAICPGNICHAQRNGLIVFRDQQHLTASFARSLSVELGKQLTFAKSSPSYAAR